MTLVMDTQSNTSARVADRIAAKRARIAARAAELAELYVGTASEMLIIAGFQDEAIHGRSNWVRTRSQNSAERALHRLPRKVPKRPANAQEWYKNGAE
jgi:hypothetical protein